MANGKRANGKSWLVCLTVFLFFRGFLGLQAYRVAHAFYTQGRETLAFFLQSRIEVNY
jgi:serine acetyltransferase